MKRVILAGIVIMTVAMFLVFLYPLLSQDTDFVTVQAPIAARIKFIGLKKVLTGFLLAAYREEMIYRGPVLLLLLLFQKRSNLAKNFWAWILLIVLSHFWAQNCHNHYAMFYQAIIFGGGLVNGACVIHFKNKAAGMGAAIFLHGLVNALVILTIYFFLM